jgi:hypothetical protein
VHEHGLNGIVLTDRQECSPGRSGAVWRRGRRQWAHAARPGQGLEDYVAWKLVTYRRFCPEFNWVPIPEKATA